MKFYAIIKGINEVQEFDTDNKKTVRAICKEKGWTVTGNKVYNEDEYEQHLAESAHPVDSDEDEDFYGSDDDIELPEAKKPVSTQNAESIEKANTPKLRGSRWAKIHEPGQGNFETKDNVMDITLGESRCQAEVLYNTKAVRTFKKAAYWLFHSLDSARASQLYGIIAEAYEQVQSGVVDMDSEADKIEATGEGWNCLIESMGDGKFKAQLSWTAAKKDRAEEARS